MRILTIFICLFLCTTSFSQKLGEQELQITYQVYIDGDYPITYPAVLHIKDSLSIYQLKPNLRQNWSGGKVKHVQTEKYISTAKVVDDSYIKINHKSKRLLSFEIMPSVTMLVSDLYPDLNWVITTETKKIAGFRCAKATTTYRGRTWLAWFTTDIAVSYGPWKLLGLPGLILEAYDADERYTMVANEIVKGKSAVFNVEFETLRATYNKKPITYKQFLDDSEEAMQNMVTKMRSEGGNVELIIPPRTGYELKYEWE